MNINVGPACLPSPDFLPMNATKEECYVSGWGSLFQSKPFKFSFHFTIKVKNSMPRWTLRLFAICQSTSNDKH